MVLSKPLKIHRREGKLPYTNKLGHPKALSAMSGTLGPGGLLIIRHMFMCDIDRNRNITL